MWYKALVPFAFIDSALDRENRWSPVFASALFYAFFLTCGVVALQPHIVQHLHTFDNFFMYEQYWSMPQKCFTMGSIAWICYFLFAIETIVSGRKFGTIFLRLLIAGGIYLTFIFLGALFPGFFEILGAIGLLLAAVAGVARLFSKEA